MGRHRSRLKILESVLSVVGNNKGVKKTQIMYQAYLSYTLLARYLNDVINAGLVVCGEDNCYKLTVKGEQFLSKFGEYSKSRNDASERMNHIEDQRMDLEEMCPNSEDEDGFQRRLEKTRLNAKEE